METIRKANNYFSSYWIVIISYAIISTYFKIGRLPSFSSPDPKQVISSYDILFTLYNYSTFLLLLGVVFNLRFLIRSVKRQERVFEWSTIFFLFNITLWLIEIFIDPFGFNAWFFD